MKTSAAIAVMAGHLIAALLTAAWLWISESADALEQRERLSTATSVAVSGQELPLANNPEPATSKSSNGDGGRKPVLVPGSAEKSTGSSAEAAATRPATEDVDLPGYRLVIAEVHDLREDDTTQRQLDRDLRRKIHKLAEELTGLSFRETTIEREVSWIRRQPNVLERQLREEAVDPLTGQTRVVRRLLLSIPPDVLESWTDRLRQYQTAWVHGLLLGIAATALLWIAALLSMAGLDRWTGGYRRGWIVFFGLLLTGCATAAIWSYVYLTYYTA